MGIRVATDIGGTFTDLVYMDEATGALGFAKVPTTPASPEQGVVEAMEEAGFASREVRDFIHGCTVVINAITERRGVRVGLLTTLGMRDVLEIGRGNRPDIYNLRYQKPRPFVPRRLRLEVEERLGPRGEVVTPLVEEDVQRAAEVFLKAGVEAVAIGFLHAYANPEHEKRAAAILGKALPGVALSLSSSITREWREYERISTAVLNAYVKPTATTYIQRLDERIRKAGVTAPFHIMQSNGGTATVEMAADAPIALVESGPVGGVAGAAFVGRELGHPDVITLDIGGTTAKTSLVRGGEVAVTTDYHLERTSRWAGYPVKVPVVDIVEIGAGGGSVAWIDERGSLRVGPKSAGAEPGPAAYGRGGTEATVTDANLIAGRLNPDFFLGGAMTLDRRLAEEALRPLAARLEVGVQEAALGILRLVNANMANAVKIISAERGHDPRDFALVAMGGGGPSHGPLIARELHIRTAIVPPSPGHFSAFGMLETDIRRDWLRTRLIRLDGADETDLTGPFAELEAEAVRAFEREGISRGEILLERRADMRYRGQEHTLSVPIPGGILDGSAQEEIARRFHAAHEDKYTFRLASAIELVNYHVIAQGVVSKPSRARLGAPSGPSLTGERRVDFDGEGTLPTPVYRREGLEAGVSVDGPAIVEETAATTVVYPGMRLHVSDFGDLVIETEAAS